MFLICFLVGLESAALIFVYDYFVNYQNIDLRYSGYLPCINVGRLKRLTYFPVELYSLVSLQHYTKASTTLQRASLVEKTHQKPQERVSVLSSALKINDYGSVPMLRSCGVYISSSFTQVDGRVLAAPKLKVANGEDFFVNNGRWNFNNKRFVFASKLERWAVVNCSARCDIRGLVRDLMRVGKDKGICALVCSTLFLVLEGVCYLLFLFKQNISVGASGALFGLLGAMRTYN